MPQPLPEDSLARALAEGQAEAYGVLYDRLAPAMLRTARTMLASTHQAEDAVHDVFLSLARSRRSLATIDDLDAYVFTALRRAVAAASVRARSEDRKLRQLAPLRLGAASAPSAEINDDLDAALADLPAEQREVIALKIDAGLTFAQIAQVLDISHNTAASRYRYALEKLRSTMEDDS